MNNPSSLFNLFQMQNVMIEGGSAAYALLCELHKKINLLSFFKTILNSLKLSKVWSFADRKKNLNLDFKKKKNHMIRFKHEQQFIQLPTFEMIIN